MREDAAFGDGERSGLLQVDVFAGAHGVDADERVPVIGRADDDGVDVFVGEQLVVIAVAGNAVVGLAGFLCVEIVDELFAVFDTMSIEVADGHDAGAVELHDAGHVVHAGDAADADGADIDAFAGRELAEDRGGNDGGESGSRSGGEGGFEESAARDSFAALVVLHRGLQLGFELDAGCVFLRLDG